MPQVVLNTNIVSYFFKDHPLAQHYRPFVENRLLAISFDDAWIAATALVYGCPLITHNSAIVDSSGTFVI